jgi:hypothetical protein
MAVLRSTLCIAQETSRSESRCVVLRGPEEGLDLIPEKRFN